MQAQWPGTEVGGAQQSAPAPSRQPAPRQQSRVSFRDDRDAIARTMLGEASNQGDQGMLAVGGVIQNRANRRGLTPSQVVLQPSQFEPWGNAETSSRLMAIGDDDPGYQNALRLADRVLAGEDVTGGADHFYAPKVMQTRGGPPAWDDGSGWDIGDHRFLALEGERSPVAEGQWPGEEWVGEEIIEEPVAEVAAPSGGTVDENGFIVAPESDRWGTEQHPWTEESIRASDGQARPGEFFRFTDASGNVRTHRLANQGMGQGDVEVLPSGIGVRETGALQNIGAGILAANEQIPFSNDIMAAGHALTTGQSWADSRQDINNLRDVDRLTDQGARNVGGVAGFGLGLLAPGAGYVQRGVGGVQRMQRAAQVGAGYGALYGAGTDDSMSALERLKSGGQGAALGGLSGGLLQGGIDRLARNQAQPASAARRLSREGVQLTPGMMMQETPVIGPLAKYAEDLASGYVPFIEGARQRSAESLGDAVANRSLAPIGERVARDASTGYERASDVYKKLGDAYDQVLPRVNAQADWDLALGLNDITARAANDLPQDHLNRLDKILNEGVVDRFTEGGALDGETFKRMETRLREASQRYQRGGVDDQIMADYLDETRDAVRDLIARQNPAEASNIADINRGYANYARMRRATRGPAQMTREGTFTPGELSNAVNQLGTEQQLATRSALMQDLASDARNILPASMGNTGSGQRGAWGAALMGGGAVGVASGMISPAIPAAILGGAAIYSKPAQTALNAVYRATDSRAASEGMQTLLELARRDPAMVPVYQSVLDDILGRDSQTPAAPPSVLNQAQAGMPVQ